VVKKNIQHEYSVVIGNGTSRAQRDLKGDLTQFKGVATIGCNWFFKEEFRPTVLITSDEPITQTILKAYKNYPRNNHWYSWYPKKGSGMKKATTPEKFGAGGMGTYIAADVVKSSKVFLVGMDFFGHGSKGKNENGQLNNMYAGKKHYVPDGVVAPTYRNWQRRFEYTIRKFSDVDFYHVDPFDGKSPERLRGFQNFHQITYENMIEFFQDDSVELVDNLVKTQEDLDLIETVNEDDLRAVIERQLAGQENIIFNDVLDVGQVIDTRVKAHEAYAKNPKAYLNIDILGFDITIPKTVIGDRKTGKQRIATANELKQAYHKEIMQRNKLKVESGIKGENIYKKWKKENK
jgi:hypothetical protein